MAQDDVRLGCVAVVVNATAVADADAVTACLDAVAAQSLAPTDTVVLVSADARPSDGRARFIIVSPECAFAAAMDACSNDTIALIDADQVPTRGWLRAIAEMVVSPATAVVVGRTIDEPGGDLAARWRAVHRSYDLGDMPLVNPRKVRGGNALVRRDRLGRLGLGAGVSAVSVVSLAQRAPGFGLTVRYAPEAIASRLAPPGLTHEIGRWCHDVFASGDLSAALDRGAQAIRADLAAGRHDIGYVSLLGSLELACRAGVSAEVIARGLRRQGVVPGDAAEVILADVARIRGGRVNEEVPPRASAAESALTGWIDGLPWAGWRRLLAGRSAVAASQGWALMPTAVGPVVMEAWWPNAWRVAAQALPLLIPGTVALLTVGRPGTSTGEAAFLVVTREVPTSESVGAWSRHLDRVTGVRCWLGAVASDALGWLPPSRAVADVFANVTCIWGDQSVVDVVPAWLPSVIPSEEALSVIDDAQYALDTGDAKRARRLAVEALLVARGSYHPDPTAQYRVLATVWPEVVDALDDMPATVAVTRAQAETHRWRFAWEGDGPGEGAIVRWRDLRSAWQPRHDGVIRAGNDGDA
jgi:hypothetical protein